MILNTLIALFLCFILLLLNSTLAKKMILDREKLSPFECGFDPKSPARLPFSLRFYLIAVIFLIFDVEITLILPIPMMINTTKMNILSAISIFFILLLIMGLYHEWNQGALEWER